MKSSPATMFFSGIAQSVSPALAYAISGKLYFGLIFWALFLFAGPMGRAAGNDAEKLLRKLQAEMVEIETVQAEFEQRKQLVMFDRELVLEGRIAVAPPGRVAWHTTSPVRYSMVIQGSELRQWDEDTNRVMTMQLDRDPAFRLAIEQMTVWFSGRYLDLLETYDIDIVQEKPYIVIVFTPRPGSAFEKVITEVGVTFRKDQLYLRTLRIVEGGGDITTLEFKETILNEPIDDKMWEVRP